jgi:hypothetical protein
VDCTVQSTVKSIKRKKKINDEIEASNIKTIVNLSPHQSFPTIRVMKV